MIIGEDENCFYVASEENQIRNQSPEADVWTPDPGSFFLASLRNGIIEDGTRRSRATQARLSRPLSTNPRSGHPAIDARGKEYKEINNAISETYGEGKEGIVIEGCAGQRYLGIGFSTRKENGKGPFKITINGFPGNCLANLNDGASFEIFGNVADDLADTMHSGSVIVHGNARDVVGQALQGGEIMVRGCVGNRAGIQMREYKKSRPVIIVGETADDYLGEYMAGGTLLVLNLGDSPRPTGSYIGTGMVGGKIYIRGTFDESRIGLPPPREDILNYLRMSALEGQISPEALEQISRAEYPTMETLSRNLPVELAQRLSSLFFSPSKRNNPIVVEKRLLSEDDLRLVRDEIKGFFKVFSLPDQLLEKVMKSVFTVIAAGDQKAQVRVPPQEVPVEE
jgi:glutamate synthase domain-containing protein 3